VYRTERKQVRVDGLTLAYREAGEGPPVLLLHGWPTSSFPWREVMVPIAGANRVIALDLPGFGASDKPLDVRYNFAFFGRALDLFLARLGIDDLGLAVHDLGGPIGLHWLLNRPRRVTKLALTLLDVPIVGSRASERSGRRENRRTVQSPARVVPERASVSVWYPTHP
jgi:pimeloyl-ACP methyl ester carboxylesterase